MHGNAGFGETGPRQVKQFILKTYQLYIRTPTHVRLLYKGLHIIAANIIDNKFQCEYNLASDEKGNQLHSYGRSL